MDNPISRAEFNQETDKIYSRLNKHESKIAILETVVKNFEGLPGAITNLDRTMVLVQENLRQLNEKVDALVLEEKNIENINKQRNNEQDNKISAIENHTKIDIIEFIKSKWWEIMLLVAMGILLLKDYIK